MPDYVIRRNGELVQVRLSYAEYDKAKAQGVEFVLQPDGAPVAIFNGSGFTRRSTDSRANRNIDHSDWRSNESWPGPPSKKVKRPKVTNWTADDFRRGAI